MQLTNIFCSFPLLHGIWNGPIISLIKRQHTSLLEYIQQDAYKWTDVVPLKRINLRFDAIICDIVMEEVRTYWRFPILTEADIDQ